MVIISIVKNQICQSNIWHKNGHIYLGDISDKKNLQKNFVKNLNKIKDIKKLKFKLKKNPVTNICKDAIKIIKNHKVLIVGCGPEQLNAIFLAKEKGLHVIGVDKNIYAKGKVYVMSFSILI